MKPKYAPNLKLIATIVSVVLGYSTHANSAEFLCDAIQSSPQALPQLAENCPIGNGLWGKSKPKGQESQFWLQCGVFRSALPLDKAKAIYQKVSADVWMKPEGGNYRCLIGPYSDYPQAQTDLKQLQTIKTYEKSFIREVMKGSEKTAVAPKKAAKKSDKKQLSSLNKKKPAEKVANPPKTSSISSEKPSNAIKNLPTVTALASSDISTRKTTVLNGVNYSVFYMLEGSGQFYMEHNQAWNRMDFDGAKDICTSQNMRLASEEEWRSLLNSKIMEKEKWPMHLPYWGAERKGLFTSGKINQLKGTSLLNVMCVK